MPQTISGGNSKQDLKLFGYLAISGKMTYLRDEQMSIDFTMSLVDRHVADNFMLTFSTNEYQQ